MEQQIKISASLTLDNEKEKDLIDTVERLRDSRQLSNFVTNIVKFALENPSLLDQAHIDSSKILMANSRLQFFEEVKQELYDMDKRIDNLDKMVAKTYELSRFGKKIGLSEKANSNLRAELVLKRHMAELKKSLGYSEYDFNRRMENTKNDLETYENKVEEFLEYVIEHYDGIVGEIVADNSIRVAERSLEVSKDLKTDEQKSVETKVDTQTSVKVEQQSLDEKENEVKKSTEEEEDKPVELNLNMAALKNFFS